ncbi:MAG: MlaD family protein [Candidatus Omnitrophica bacterium]|nr:MlaD family protein [Candidatus Omnitrophota bacterium]
MPSAEQIRWAKTRITITILVALTILSVLIYLLAGTKLFIPKAMIRTYLSTTEGLEGGASVRLDGIGIGWVSRIGFSGLKDSSKALEVRMIVDARYLPQIPQDSVVEVTSDNLLGDKYVEITSGKSPVAVRRGGVLPHQPPNVALSRIDMQTFEDNLRAIDALLKDIQEGKGAFGDLIIGEKLYNDVLFKVTRLEKSLAAAKTGGVVGKLLTSDEIYRSLREPALRLNAQLAEIQAGRGTAGEFIRTTKMHDSLEKSIDEVQRSVDQLGAKPFFSSDELYVKWNRSLVSLIRSLDELNAGKGTAGSLLSNPQVYESLNGSLRQLQAQLRDFRQNPRKYLRVRSHLF